MVKRVLIAWLFLSAAVTSAQIKTDTGVYPLPALPAMGANAGSKIVDPAFGTTIMRLTDGAFGNTQCTVAYANVPSFNADSSRVYVRCAPFSVAVLFKLDAATFTASARSTLSSAPSGAFQYWSLWSGVNPDILYVPAPTAIYAYNVATSEFTVSTLASSVLTSGQAFDAQMSRSEDDTVWADKFNGGTGGYVVWRIEPIGYKTVLLKVDASGVNELPVDKRGRCVAAVMATSRPGSSDDIENK